jgi:nitrite reductase (cytochrome c-552)
MANACMNRHRGTEQELRDTVARKLERKAELNSTATGVIGKAHLEAGKAWEGMKFKTSYSE